MEIKSKFIWKYLIIKYILKFKNDFFKISNDLDVKKTEFPFLHFFFCVVGYMRKKKRKKMMNNKRNAACFFVMLWGLQKPKSGLFLLCDVCAYCAYNSLHAN